MNKAGVTGTLIVMFISVAIIYVREKADKSCPSNLIGTCIWGANMLSIWITQGKQGKNWKIEVMEKPNIHEYFRQNIKGFHKRFFGNLRKNHKGLEYPFKTILCGKIPTNPSDGFKGGGGQPAWLPVWEETLIKNTNNPIQNIKGFIVHRQIISMKLGLNQVGAPEDKFSMHLAYTIDFVGDNNRRISSEHI